MSLGLGLDTGGTYTDAVVMDLDDGRILSKSKSMTTYEDLCIGIEAAIDLLDQSLLGSIGVVALSSTLATNSIVEGKGCRVGLICIGRDYDRTLSADYYTVIKGGNDVDICRSGTPTRSRPSRPSPRGSSTSRSSADTSSPPNWDSTSAPRPAS